MTAVVVSDTIEAVAMSEKLEVVRGSGNVFRDFGLHDADVRQLEAILAAEIIKALDREGLSVRGAHGRAAIALAAATTRDGARAKVEAGLHDRDAGHAAAHDPQRRALEQ